MIQRVQTVYLFLVLGLMIVVLFVPVASNISFYWLFQLDAVATAILATGAIFFYKRRDLQIRLGNIILVLLLLAYVIVFVFNKDFFLDFSILKQNLRFTFFFPLLAVLFDLLAIKGVRKDEKLVRSADRLRG
jgi:amino acid transporter